MTKYSTFILMILTVVLTLTGCGPKKPSDLPKLYPVQLTFTQENQPLAGAAIALIPEEQSTHYTSGGTTNEQGVLIVMTHGVYPGVPAGKYTVTVSKDVLTTSGTVDLKPTTEAEAHEMGLANKDKLKTVGYRLVDQKYSSPKVSELKVTVTNAAVMQTFDLGKAVKIPMSESDMR